MAKIEIYILVLALILPLCVSAGESKSTPIPNPESEEFINLCADLIRDFSRLGLTASTSFLADLPLLNTFFKENNKAIKNCISHLQI